jgi:hypothetical protein
MNSGGQQGALQRCSCEGTHIGQQSQVVVGDGKPWLRDVLGVICVNDFFVPAYQINRPSRINLNPGFIKIDIVFLPRVAKPIDVSASRKRHG